MGRQEIAFFFYLKIDKNNVTISKMNLGGIMKRAFIFDLFGTLVNIYDKNNYFSMIEKMANILEIDFEEFSRYWNEETYDDRMIGKFKNNSENLYMISKQFNLNFSSEKIEKAVMFRREFTKKSLLSVREGLTDILQNMKNNGYKLALISDCSPDVPDVWKELEYAKYFDVVLFSCEVKLKKPDERIYNLALERLELEAKDCYYIGDGGSFELTGAKRVGMHPILIKSLEDEKKDVYKKYTDNFDGDRIFSLIELKKYM